MTETADFEQVLEAVLVRTVPAVRQLVSAERLSGGASQETYQLTVETDEGIEFLALRRAPGGEPAEDLAGRPGLAIEAELMDGAIVAAGDANDIRVAAQQRKRERDGPQPGRHEIPHRVHRHHLERFDLLADLHVC